ncbi:MAG TPA: hypothetical protein VF272_00380 [Candidatus Saccharimonadia bacterium]
MKTHSSYERLAESVEELGITKSNMFGMPVLKLGRKPVAGLASDGINQICGIRTSKLVIK